MMATGRCSTKATQLRAIADRFRTKARETEIPDYVQLMYRYAAEFDRVAEGMETGERADEDKTSCVD